MTFSRGILAERAYFVLMIEMGVYVAQQVVVAACNVRCKDLSHHTAKTSASDTTSKDYVITSGLCIRMWNTVDNSWYYTTSNTVTKQRDELLAHGGATYSCYFQGGAYGEAAFGAPAPAGNPQNFACYTACMGPVP